MKISICCWPYVQQILNMIDMFKICHKLYKNTDNLLHVHMGKTTRFFL